MQTGKRRLWAVAALAASIAAGSATGSAVMLASHPAPGKSPAAAPVVLAADIQQAPPGGVPNPRAGSPPGSAPQPGTGQVTYSDLGEVAGHVCDVYDLSKDIAKVAARTNAGRAAIFSALVTAGKKNVSKLATNLIPVAGEINDVLTAGCTVTGLINASRVPGGTNSAPSVAPSPSPSPSPSVTPSPSPSSTLGQCYFFGSIDPAACYN